MVGKSLKRPPFWIFRKVHFYKKITADLLKIERIYVSVGSNRKILKKENYKIENRTNVIKKQNSGFDSDLHLHS